MVTDGKSKAQNALAAKIQECFPYAHVSQENYIVDLIEECGFTTQEMRRELGHEPHRMFVDIVMRDSEETIAFEYHGEQHYSLVGNMTKTDADLLLNQQLDQEKSWILSRIGIPLVPVPFDMYIDESVLYDAIDKAYESMAQDAKGYVACSNCDRLFPPSQLRYGTCKSCEEKIAEEELSEAEAAEQESFFENEPEEVEFDESTMSYEDFKAKQKEIAKQKRKEAYQAYKQSDAYQQKKEREKQYRQKMNRQRKEENRRQRREEKARKRAEKLEAQE